MPVYNELPYDFEDFGLEAYELHEKYGDGGHPEYTIEDWHQCPVEEEEATNGYWDWVAHKIEIDDEATPSTTEDG